MTTDPAGSEMPDKPTYPVDGEITPDAVRAWRAQAGSVSPLIARERLTILCDEVAALRVRSKDNFDAYVEQKKIADALRAELEECRMFKAAREFDIEIFEKVMDSLFIKADQQGDTIFELRDENQRLRKERDHARAASKRWREVAEGSGAEAACDRATRTARTEGPVMNDDPVTTCPNGGRCFDMAAELADLRKRADYLNDAFNAKCDEVAALRYVKEPITNDEKSVMIYIPKSSRYREHGPLVFAYWIAIYNPWHTAIIAGALFAFVAWKVQ